MQSPLASPRATVQPVLPQPAVRTEIPEPFGYGKIDIEDQTQGFVFHAFEQMLTLAGKLGLRHIEVKKGSQAHYNCIGVGFKVNIHLDDLVALLFDAQGQRKSSITDVYLAPIPIRRLEQFESLPGDPSCLPGLVVQVPTKEFLIRSHTRSLDVQTVQLNGASEWMNALFPSLVDANGLVHVSDILNASAPGKIKTEDGATRLVSAFEAVNQQSSSVECTVEAGSLSPKRAVLPRVRVQILSTTDLESIIANPKEWHSPVPVGPKEFSAVVRTQLDTIFQYMYVLHAPRDSPVTQRDHPKEFVLERHPQNNLLYRCIAIGYSGQIGLADMIRLYLCDSSRIRDVYYDCTRKARNSNIPPGALVVEFQVDPPNASPSSIPNPGLVRMLRSEIPAKLLPPAATEPLATISPIPSVAPSASPPTPRFVLNPDVPSRKRKQEEVEALPPPPPPPLLLQEERLEQEPVNIPQTPDPVLLPSISTEPPPVPSIVVSETVPQVPVQETVPPPAEKKSRVEEPSTGLLKKLLWWRK